MITAWVLIGVFKEYWFWSVALCEDFGLAEIESALSCLTSKPFSQKSEREKDELFEKIAEQLAIIADHYNLDSPSSPPLLYAASQSKENEEKKSDDQEGAGMLIYGIFLYFRRINLYLCYLKISCISF